MDRLSDFKLGSWHGVVITAEKDWRGIGGLKLQSFAIATFSSYDYYDYHYHV